MLKKYIITSLLGLSFQISAITTEKYSVQAGKPTIKQASQSTANQLVLAVGSFDPIAEQLNFNKSKIPTVESTNYSIVQFYDGKADARWLQKNGIEVVSYIPNNAFIIKNSKTSSKTLKSNQNIRWSGRYLSAYKISPELWNTKHKRQTGSDLNVVLFNDFPRTNIKKLFRKYLPKVIIKEILTSAQNQILISLNGQNTQETIKQLALIDAIQFVEPYKALKYLNTEAVSSVQGNINPDGLPTDDSYTPSNTPIWDRGITGAGQIVGIADSGLDSNEDWFTHYDNGQTITHIVTEAENTTPPTVGSTYPDRKVFGYFVMPGAEAYDEAGASFHGTHVSGSVAGDRLEAIGAGPSGSISSPSNSGYDNDDGMAPNAQILFQDLGAVIEVDGEPEAVLSGQGSSPMWQQAYAAGVRIHSNSYGSDGDGAYSFSDQRVDNTLHELEDMLIVFAAGNDGSADNTIGSPGNAKNVLTVGMMFHGNSEFVNTGSSRGPTDDGRIKPDTMASGSNIESAAGNTENSTTISPPARATQSGTSMATPITAGSSALMRQYYIEGYYPTGIKTTADQHTPTGPLMKATLINGAGIDGGHFDKDVGWGRINLENSILFDDSDKQLRAWEVTNPNGLKTGESIEFKIEVKADQDLAVTLAWYDLPGPFGSSKTLINDLDLSVKINGQTYKGNVFSSVAVSGTGGNRDSLNTVEQVRIPTPEEGLYTITVTGTNIPGDGSLNAIRQGFGLVATGHFDNVGSAPPAMTSVTDLTSATLNDNGIKLSWNGGNNADYFEVYRTVGTCSTADFKDLRFVGNSADGNYTDFRTLNGIQYAYKIRAGQYGELGPLSNTCTDITSQQACDFLPSFNQSSIQVIDNTGDSCHTKLQWNTATANCPTNTLIKYNIYRSEDPDFLPDSSNLLTTVTNTSYDDIRAPESAAYYIVRAEDNSPNGSGPNGGTETTGTSRVRSQAIGIGFTSGALLEDVDNVSIMNLEFPWQVVSSKSFDGALSYKTGEGFGNYPPDQCRSIVTNTISLSNDDPNPEVSYKALYNLEENWDGVVVEISSDNGNTWQDLPPNGGYPGNFSETTNNPVNACGYASTHGAFSGSNNNTFETFTHDLSPFVGTDIKLRWRLSSDPASEFEGFYIDSIQYPNIQSPNSCTANTAPNGPSSGLYSDGNHNGHGFAIEPLGIQDSEGREIYFTVFYTYKDDGTPEWYTSVDTLDGNVLSGEMFKPIYDYSIDPTGSNQPFTLDTSEVRNLSIDFNQSALNSSDCNTNGSSSGVANWQIGNETGSWCINNLDSVFGPAPQNDFGGTWWTGQDDDGWGLSMTFTENSTIIVTMYYFDANGYPRWTQGVGTGYQQGQEITLTMNEVTGYGRTTTPIENILTAAGTLTVKLNNHQGEVSDGSLFTDITYRGNEGGTWTRTNVPVILFSGSH